MVKVKWWKKYVKSKSHHLPQTKNVACPHATLCQPSWMMFIFMHDSKWIINKPPLMYLIIKRCEILSWTIIHANIHSKITFSRKKCKKTRFCSQWASNLQLTKNVIFPKLQTGFWLNFIGVLGMQLFFSHSKIGETHITVWEHEKMV